MSMKKTRNRWIGAGLAVGLAMAGCSPDTDVEDIAAMASEAEEQGVDNREYPREVAEVSTEYEPLRIVKVAGGLENPWSIAFMPDGTWLVTERPGRLQHVREDGSLTEIGGVPEVVARNQGGLLEVSLHPEFESNQLVYLTYSLGDTDETTVALGRGRLEDDALHDFEVLFEQDRRSGPGRHYGSRLAWMPDGTLLMSVGDRGAEPPRAQDPMDHAGTLLRLTETGGVPDDNPFADGNDALPEIYSWGHRNIQGLIVRSDGEIWVTEHGPRGGDELNLIEAGGNYGWPVAGKGRDYRTEERYGEARSKEGMIDPVHEFLPTLAPSGLAEVTGDLFARWQGNLLAGGLRPEWISRVVLEDGVVVHEEVFLRGEIGRIRDVREGPDGFIYVVIDETEGGLYRLEPLG